MFSLKELFDKQVVVTLQRPFSPNEKLFYYEIIGKRGFVYPQNEKEVCVQTTPRIGAKLLALFGSKARYKRRSDVEFELIIPVELTSSVFRYIKPKRRKQFTPEQKAAMTARLKQSLPPQFNTSQSKQADKTAKAS